MSSAKKITMIVMIVAVAVSAVLLSPLGKTRKLDTDYALTFDGTTAICTATVTGERKNDSLQVTMQLKQDDTVLKTWYQEGDFQVVMEETCEGLTKGKVYTLEISAVINGTSQPVVTAKRTCPGGTTSTTQPTTPPTTQPTVPVTPAEEGSAVIFQGPPFSAGYPEWYPREGKIDHLYWAVKSTGESILVCDEPVVNVTKDDTHIFFVKKSEPTKVYVTAIGDFKNHQVYYQSSYGDISDFRIFLSDNLMHFVADGNKLVVCDITTGESKVLMEQYHINFALIFSNDDGTLEDWIEFEGQHTEDDDPYTLYLYNWKTGELWEDTTL